MVRPCVASGFVNLADAVLHQCIRPLIGAWCAPGHHGYQRAFELISGQASNGPFGSPVFACAGKTDPPSSSHPLADLGGYSGRRLADPQAGIVRKIRGEGPHFEALPILCSKWPVSWSQRSWRNDVSFSYNRTSLNI